MKINFFERNSTMKSKYLALMSLILVTSLHSSSTWDTVKNAAYTPIRWVGSKLPTPSGIWETTKWLARKPTTLAVGGLAGAGTYELGKTIGSTGVKSLKSPQLAMAGVGGAILLANTVTFVNWIRLRNNYLALEKKQTSSSDPYIRNVWYQPDGKAFTNGHHIVLAFSMGTDEQRHRIKTAFLKQLSVSNDEEAVKRIDVALKKIENALEEYKYYTNIQYKLACFAGFSTPDELLSSDELIENDMNGELKNEFDAETEFGIYSLRLNWATRLNVPYVRFYSWNYSMASHCVWLCLRNYAFLKAIRKVMESPTGEGNTQKHTVYLKYEDMVKAAH